MHSFRKKKLCQRTFTWKVFTFSWKFQHCKSIIQIWAKKQPFAIYWLLCSLVFCDNFETKSYFLIMTWRLQDLFVTIKIISRVIKIISRVIFRNNYSRTTRWVHVHPPGWEILQWQPRNTNIRLTLQKEEENNIELALWVCVIKGWWENGNFLLKHNVCMIRLSHPCKKTDRNK